MALSQNYNEEHLYSIALRKCTLIGDINFKKLVNQIGSAKAVWETPRNILSKIEGIGTKTLSELGSKDQLLFAEKELKFCEKNNIEILLRHLGQYPTLLDDCEDAPAILYQKGEMGINAKSVSIVGTRHVTAYGKEFVKEFVKTLSTHKSITVSGLALGADTEVHEQSLIGNIPTIAVLAHGFHTLYPSKNRVLSEKILENGGLLLSEFNSSQKPDRENFIQRNRIVAGLSEATIVVESAFGGGSMSTATFANGYNREVYALPGKITDKYSQGCNQLIAQNKANIISTIPDLIENLGFGNNRKEEELFPKEELFSLSPAQQEIVMMIQSQPNISLDDLCELLKIPSYQLLGILLELELMNVVHSTSSRQYKIRKLN
ncbi:MAG: DNA-protecting protein DprA [Bacteroidetes bacterium]|jgi:DNA processing protein|nr:DNA-protecting protein DprA [Bacteroidota bacterium]